jgi:hypothetical protein
MRVGDFNTSLSPIDAPRQKNQQRNIRLIETIGQMKLRDIYGVFHPATRQYIFFLGAHGIFFKIDHI